MGADQLLACRHSGAWPKYKVALLCIMVCALSGCGKREQVLTGKAYSEIRSCSNEAGPTSPPDMDEGAVVKFWRNQSIERLNQCLTARVNDYVRSTGKNKRAALEHYGFTCLKSKENECHWTVLYPYRGVYSFGGQNEVEYLLTKIEVDLKRNTMTIIRSMAINDGHFMPIYSKVLSF